MIMSQFLTDSFFKICRNRLGCSYYEGHKSSNLSCNCEIYTQNVLLLNVTDTSTLVKLCSISATVRKVEEYKYK